MPFSTLDFNKENAQRLCVIIMKQMGKNILTPFKSLGSTKQAKFNRLLNEYIQSLPEDWEPVLMRDFNQIVEEDLLNEEFDPSTTFIPVIDTDRKLLNAEEVSGQS